ncbi:prenyltransferase [Corynebacterium heidelbergense]|uniref:Prenyltransferase n=1 Tax=Corynebacterium heidelbergense TaxID=2055947 RepID=A0A364VAN0_9CORY|nr:prenyltransferase [Corynebacterium heidelbergense]RAV33705.1 prenyltransferase [Corynebacterium heidelbergense]WCZ35745.1 prenyltransferase [Corynebacterium heidelbergense]
MTGKRSTLPMLFSVSRPLSWVNTAYPFGVAYALVTREVSWTLILGTLFFLIPYNLAMYGINDVFDYESDLVNPRKGGVEGAVAPPDNHRTILIASAVATIPFLVYLVAVGNLSANLVLAFSVFAVIAYSAKGLRFKEIPFVDSATSAVHFVSPMVYALVLADVHWSAQLVAVCAAFFCWSMASQAFGAVQDVVADRAGGLRSIATQTSAAFTTKFSVVMYVLSAVLLLLSLPSARIVAILLVPYIANIAPYWNVAERNAESANRAWRRFLWLNYVTGALISMYIIALQVF